MPNVVIPALDPDFTTWYIPADLKDDSERRVKRWSGLHILIDQLNPRLIEALVRLACKSRQTASPDSLQIIRKAFSDTDDTTFPAAGNDREIEILSAATLGILLKSDSPNAARAALAVTTSSFGGNRKFALSTDLNALAENAIRRIALSQRRRESSLAAPTKVDLDFTTVNEALEVNSLAGVTQAFLAAEESLNTCFDQVLQSATEATSHLQRLLLIQDEELQMLWWLVGERSWDFDCAFSGVPIDLQPLVFSKELADASNILPGPSAIKPLLSRAGLKDRKKTRVSDVINSDKTEWLREVITDKDVSPIIHPLHFAISRQLETGPGNSWVAGWAATAGIPEDIALTPLFIGNLFYRERLLFKGLNG